MVFEGKGRNGRSRKEEVVMLRLRVEKAERVDEEGSSFVLCTAVVEGMSEEQAIEAFVRRGGNRYADQQVHKADSWPGWTIRIFINNESQSQRIGLSKQVESQDSHLVS